MHWTTHLEGGPRRVNHAAVAVGDKIYCFGGYCTGDNYQDPSPIDVFVLHTLTNRWVAVPKPKNLTGSDWPVQRYGHTVVHYQNRIILFGGRSDSFISSYVYVFDPLTWTWSRPKTWGRHSPVSTRDGHTSCVIGNKMYVFGGFAGYTEIMLGRMLDLIYLDLDTYEWKTTSAKGDPPAWRDFHSATAIGDRMYVFGGRCVRNNWIDQSDEYYENTISYYDVATNTWERPNVVMGDLVPEGRRSHSALNLDGHLMIFGGYNSATGVHKNDMWLFNVDSNVWTQIQAFGEGPEPRRRQAMCMVGTKVYLFGGTSPYSGPPILYTQEQLDNMPEEWRTGEMKLIDHSDLHVLDLNPSLKTLAMVHILKCFEGRTLEGLELPKDVLSDLNAMHASNTISSPLPIQSVLMSG